MKVGLIVLVAVSLAAAPLSAARQGGAKPSTTAPTVRVGGDIKPPLKIKNVDPVYPPLARQNRVQGVIILEVTIGTDGKVNDTKTIRSLNLLLEGAAITAVRGWEFKPTLVDGKPVQVIMTIPINFILE